MRRLLALLAALALGLPAVAQTSFTVTVGPKTAAHPYVGQGHAEGFAIGGVQGAALTLVRGQTYTFQMDGTPSSHPFYISTSPAGGGDGAWADGVTGNFASGTSTLTFTVPTSAPDELWYQCGVHDRMGWRIAIVSATAVDDGVVGFALDLAAANPGRSPVSLRLTVAKTASATLEVFAADGRRVAVLHDGPLTGGLEHPFALDAAALAAGVYIVRASSGAWVAERRVTVLR
ncbi:hypothetical protein [Rubrivirga sp. IMCC43871]|uniref:hypothetical protein n=1 Tax=Rubrivirga sp. IMCC43871 TaxID=3391575 RepID=UPI00398FA750